MLVRQGSIRIRRHDAAKLAGFGGIQEDGQGALYRFGRGRGVSGGLCKGLRHGVVRFLSSQAVDCISCDAMKCCGVFCLASILREIDIVSVAFARYDEYPDTHFV